MEEREFYEQQARLLIKRYRRDAEISYKELARRLEAHGLKIEPQVLTNRINRGTYTFSFALHLLAALGVATIDVPKFSRPRAKSKKASAM